MLQLVGGSFVADDDGMGVLLQAADGPHVVDGLFNTMAEGTGFIVAVDHNHHLLGIHDCADTYGESGLGDLIDVIVEEAAVGDDGIGSQGLLAGTACKAGAWLVEGDMAVGANAAHEQVDTACCLNGFLVILALCLQILGIAIEDMDILFLDVDVTKEVVPHEAMIALGMFLGQVHILVHVERNHILERHLAGFVQGNQLAVHAQRGTAGWAAELKGLVSRRLCFVNTLGHIICSPFRHFLVVGFNN